MFVVTGATGHLGNVLVRTLAALGEKVRAVVLPKEDTSNIDIKNVEKFEADIRDKNALRKAFKGAEGVFHLASLISIIPGKDKLLYDVNVNGTRNVIESCISEDVKRLVYTSSIHALEEPPHGKMITEEMPFSPEKALGAYGKTKALASLEVINSVRKGLDSVLVCPTGITGPYDFKLSFFGRMILDFIRRRFKFYISGEYDFVDVRDVADGLIKAFKKGRKGEAYILSGEQISIKEIFRVLEESTGVKAPSYKVPFWMGQWTAFFSELRARISGQDEPLNRESLAILKSNSLVGCGKAIKELGFTHRSIKEALKDSVEWIKNYVALKMKVMPVGAG